MNVFLGVAPRTLVQNGGRFTGAFYLHHRAEYSGSKHSLTCSNSVISYSNSYCKTKWVIFSFFHFCFIGTDFLLTALFWNNDYGDWWLQWASVSCRLVGWCQRLEKHTVSIFRTENLNNLSTKRRFIPTNLHGAQIQYHHQSFSPPWKPHNFNLVHVSAKWSNFRPMLSIWSYVGLVFTIWCNEMRKCIHLCFPSRISCHIGAAFYPFTKCCLSVFLHLQFTPNYLVLISSLLFHHPSRCFVYL
jgi:hypothetical protein